MLSTLSTRSQAVLKKLELHRVEDFADYSFPDLLDHLPLNQYHDLLRHIRSQNIHVRFDAPSWSQQEWKVFMEKLVERGIVSWDEIALTVCGELNPPQVGTSIASSKSFQRHFGPKETMRNVMSWFYAQRGRCEMCGTRLFLETDHVIPKSSFSDPLEADELSNLQLLCRRCNTTKRPSHQLGWISFASAQAVLIWIILHHNPANRETFHRLCRRHGLTMASIRFDEAWAFAEWLRREQPPIPVKKSVPLLSKLRTWYRSLFPVAQSNKSG